MRSNSGKDSTTWDQIDLIFKFAPNELKSFLLYECPHFYSPIHIFELYHRFEKDEQALITYLRRLNLGSTRDFYGASHPDYIDVFGQDAENVFAGF